MVKKIVFIQPTLAPYAKTRFEELAKDKQLDIYLLFEHKTLPHRKGWEVTPVKGCKTIVIGGHNLKSKVYKPELNAYIEGVRGIPYTIPKYLMNIKPDIVIVCNASQLLFVNSVKKILNFKTGIIVEDTIHATKGRSNLSKRLKKIALNLVDFYLPFSNDAIEYLHVNGINNSIYKTSWSMKTDLFYNDNEVSEIRRKIRSRHKLDNKVVFITLTQLIPRKGLKNLIESWNDSDNRLKSDAELLILGDGPEKEDLIELLVRRQIYNVQLLGNKSYTEVAEYLQASDIFILPTLEDLFSLSVMEAMASKLPVMTSIYNGARELIIESKNGYVFDSKSKEDTIKALNNMYSDKGRLNEMGNLSYEIISNYTDELVMRKLGNTLKGIK
ncbi:glycosyltransferase family 4 protein [Neobacillus jeddahensis]|uniref:glycosyltransferase family 4 protein n=1 Tax=Neobacillus jeddahensis TaxID=1461580 RepID=UPI000590543C|nr:glycosyltransferase family 4 protein [Neobacillus jeddahensis]